VSTETSRLHSRNSVLILTAQSMGKGKQLKLLPPQLQLVLRD
jgi:hypothetical protein